MSESFFIPGRSLTAQLVAKGPCGPTCHEGCATNYEWCLAECSAQNAKCGKPFLMVCNDNKGHVWIALKDRAPANWSAHGGVE